MADYELKFNVALALAGRYTCVHFSFPEGMPYSRTCYSKDKFNSEASRNYVALLIKRFTNEGAEDLGLSEEARSPENIVKHS